MLHLHSNHSVRATRVSQAWKEARMSMCEERRLSPIAVTLWYYNAHCKIPSNFPPITYSEKNCTNYVKYVSNFYTTKPLFYWSAWLYVFWILRAFWTGWQLKICLQTKLKNGRKSKSSLNFRFLSLFYVIQNCNELIRRKMWVFQTLCSVRNATMMLPWKIMMLWPLLLFYPIFTINMTHISPQQLMLLQKVNALLPLPFMAIISFSIPSLEVTRRTLYTVVLCDQSLL